MPNRQYRHVQKLISQCVEARGEGEEFRQQRGGRGSYNFRRCRELRESVAQSLSYRRCDHNRLIVRSGSPIRDSSTNRHPLAARQCSSLSTNHLPRLLPTSAPRLPTLPPPPPKPNPKPELRVSDFFLNMEQQHHLSVNDPAEPPEMENPLQRTPHQEDIATEAAAAAAAWDWGNLLDFTFDDDHSILSWDPPEPAPPLVQPRPPSSASERVRKRDPRLICENFLAGRVPCACPEMDEKAEEEGGAGKKRARTASAALVRCQVPGCEADIRELKGYHRRHRVCLRCANASTVMIDGEAKRYCQQCGK